MLTDFNTEILIDPFSLPIPKIRILVLEGYNDVAESLMMLLQMAGHEVETAAFCKIKEIEAAQTSISQFVQFDIGCLDLNCQEIARSIGRLQDHHGVVQLALTGLD
jgi:response regulator RpfG family c-di-GMP phosphodiesterase